MITPPRTDQGRIHADTPLIAAPARRPWTHTSGLISNHTDPPLITPPRTDQGRIHAHTPLITAQHADHGRSTSGSISKHTDPPMITPPCTDQGRAHAYTPLITAQHADHGRTRVVRSPNTRIRPDHAIPHRSRPHPRPHALDHGSARRPWTHTSGSISIHGGSIHDRHEDSRRGGVHSRSTRQGVRCPQGTLVIHRSCGRPLSKVRSRHRDPMGYARVRALGLVGLEGHAVTVEAHVAAGHPALHHLRPPRRLPQRGPRPGPRRRREHRGGLATATHHGQPAPGRPAQTRLRLRPRHRRGGARCGRRAAPRRARAAPPSSANSASTARSDPSGACCRWCWPPRRTGVSRIIVPADNAAEAALVPGVQVRGAETSRASSSSSPAPSVPLPEPSTVDESRRRRPGLDLADVVGQERGRFALELAAAGQHHLALFGPPGAGKTMLAQRLPTILPPLDDAASLEVTAVHSIAGTLPAAPRLIRRPPFQAPHHTATAPALVGGGTGLARPGALSLAHLGVLFLDEAPEFRPSRAQRAAAAAGGRLGDAGPVPGHHPVPGPGAAGARGQPVPVRRRQGHRLYVHRRWSGGGTWPGCRGRCWTASTCRSRWPR